MDEKPTTDAYFESLKRKKARQLEEAAATDREMAEYAQLLQLAAKFKRGLVSEEGEPARIETISDLIANYKSSSASPYQKLKFASKRHYEAVLGMIDADHGTAPLATITEDELKEWHRQWSEGGRVASAFSKIGMVRGVCGFGTEVLKDAECSRLYGVLSTLKFEAPKARTAHLTADQANRIRAEAHRVGRHSIALAMAFQFDTPLRQKDIIGEWVPMSEKDVGFTDVFRGDKLKWVRGIRWEAINDNLILIHAPMPSQPPVRIDIKKAPMVMEELERIKAANDGKLPKRGPVIIAERLKKPWNEVEYRRQWRILADACNIPKGVRSSDTANETDPQDTDAGGARELK